MTSWWRIGVALGIVDEPEREPARGVTLDEARAATEAPWASSRGPLEASSHRPSTDDIAAPGRSVTIRPSAPKPQTIAPQNKDDLRRAIDALRHGQTVILDVSHVPSELRHRMLDFLSGGCSAMTTRMEKVAVNVLLLDPTPATRDEGSPRLAAREAAGR